MANVLIIGLDGATWRVLEPWARAGRLPHLAGLMARGSWGTLRSTVPALTLPAWSSLTTGRNPGAHGVFAFRRLAPDRYDSPGLASTSDLRAPTLWEIAGRAGRRAGIINVPPSYPIRPLNGFVVSCLLTPPGECFTHPPELASELGGYRIDLQPPRGVALDEAVNREQALAYLQGLRRLTSGRTAAALHLMRTRPTDVLGVVFYAPDRIQHCFWTYVDGGVAPDTEVATAVAGVYAALDQGLGDLTAAAGPEATVILVSDHGFGPKPSHAVHVNRWLADAGFLRQRPLWTLRRKVIRKVLPRSWRSRLDVIDHILVHRPRSRAWADTLEPGTAAVWIHVAGRYPYGCVGPGAEYEAVRTEIVTGLQALRGPEGEPVLQAVRRRDALEHPRYVGAPRASRRSAISSEARSLHVAERLQAQPQLLVLGTRLGRGLGCDPGGQEAEADDVTADSRRGGNRHRELSTAGARRAEGDVGAGRLGRKALAAPAGKADESGHRPDGAGRSLDLVHAVRGGDRDEQGSAVARPQDRHASAGPEPAPNPQRAPPGGRIDRRARYPGLRGEPPELGTDEEARPRGIVTRAAEQRLASREPPVEARAQTFGQPRRVSLEPQPDAARSLHPVQHDVTFAAGDERAGDVPAQQKARGPDSPIALPGVVDGRLPGAGHEAAVRAELRPAVHPRARWDREPEQLEQGRRHVDVLGDAVAHLSRSDTRARDDPRDVVDTVGERVGVTRAALLTELLAVIRGDDHERAAEVRIVLPDGCQQAGELRVGVRQARVVHRCEVAAVEVAEVARVGAQPAAPLAVKARLAIRLEAPPPVVARDREARLAVREVARHVHVHEVDVEEDGPAPVPRAPDRSRPVDDVPRVGMAARRLALHELQAVELTPQIARRHEPGMRAHAERLEAASPQHGRQEGRGRIALAERELARVLVRGERPEHVLEVVAAGHELGEGRPRGMRVREVATEEGARRGEPVERRRRRIRVAPGAQTVGPRRVEHDEEDRRVLRHAPR